MATHEKIKLAMREIRKTLGMKVYLIKTSTQKERLSGNYYTSVFITKEKIYINYPRDKNVANKIFNIFKNCVDNDFRIDWNMNINTSMVLIPKDFNK